MLSPIVWIINLILYSETFIILVCRKVGNIRHDNIEDVT